MRYVELQVVCKHHQGRGPIIGAWYIESQHEEFDPQLVNQRPTKGLEPQRVVGSDGSWCRYRMSCSQCPHSPVLRQDTVNAALAAVYVPKATAKVVVYAL